jgi:uncharacterized membrane protein
MNGPLNRRWLLGGLVASLVLNAFLIGAIATDLLRASRKHDGPRSLSFELRWLEGRLPREGFDQVAAAVAGARPATERHIERLKELREGLGVFVAEPAPDRTAIDGRLREIRAELETMVAEIQKTAMDALVALPPEMRGKLAEADTANPR